MASNNNNNSSSWDNEAMFRFYLHDYLIKRGLHSTAEIFMNEANVPNNPVDIKFLDPVLDSPEGLLQEWWSVFYDVFLSRQTMHQESEPQFSNRMVAGMPNTARNSSSFRIPQMPMFEQRPQQFQASSSINNMMAQPAQNACMMSPRLHNNDYVGSFIENIDPSLVAFIKANNPNLLSRLGSNSNHPLQDIGTQVQNQVYKDSGISMRVGSPIPRSLIDARQKAILPLNGPHATNNFEAPNRVPINGRPLNNQMLTSPPQTPNYEQQSQVLNTQNHDTILTQAFLSTLNSPTLASPRNSTRSNSQYPEIPKTESSNKNREMMDQITRAREGEPQYKQDQKMQMQSQNLDSSRKRKVTALAGPGVHVPDCVNVADHGNPADDNVDSYLCIEKGNADHRALPFSNLKRISGTNCRSENKGFSLQEVGCLHSSKSKVLASHFSSNGKVLACAGHDKKVFLWNMENFKHYATEETHSLLITDVRFRQGSTVFATSSFDKSVRVWDTTRPAKSLFKLTDHSDQVLSLDFHPRKVDILCSCDRNDIIRLWNVNQRSCKHIIKGGSKQVRFQPLSGKLLATATGNNVKIIDVEATSLVSSLKGHDKDVVSICWDRSGKYIASVSEDSARVWSDGKCIGELLSNGNKFQSCIFHPAYSNLLILGGYQSLEFWCPTESSRTVSVSAHKGLIAGLADSPEDELIASAGHDCIVKLWR